MGVLHQQFSLPQALAEGVSLGVARRGPQGGALLNYGQETFGRLELLWHLLQAQAQHAVKLQG